MFEHSQRVDRQWKEEKFKREEERLAREERIKVESGEQPRLKRVKREYSQEVESNIMMQEHEDFSVKAEYEHPVYGDGDGDVDDEDEDGMRD